MGKNLLLLGLVGTGAAYAINKKSTNAKISKKDSPESNTPKQEKPVDEGKTGKFIRELKNNISGLYIYKYPSLNISSDQEAPLIIIADMFIEYFQQNQPSDIDISKMNFTEYLTKHKYFEVSALKNFPTNLPARVFYFSAKEHPSIVAETFKNGIIYLQKLYPTNKIIYFGFGRGSEIGLLLATHNVVDYLFVYNNSLTMTNSYIGVDFPGFAIVRGWLPSHATGSEWYKVNPIIQSLNEQFKELAKANFPVPEFLVGSQSDKITTAELYKIAMDFINSSQNFKTSIELVHDYINDNCRIKIDSVGEATWVFTQGLVNYGRKHKEITVQLYNNYFSNYFHSIDKSCDGKVLYSYNPTSAMYLYWIVRSAIKAVMHRGLMSEETAEIIIGDAKQRAIAALVQNNPKYLPKLEDL